MVNVVFAARMVEGVKVAVWVRTLYVTDPATPVIKNVLGLMVSESICSSKVTLIFWSCGTHVAPAATLTAKISGGDVSLVVRVVNEKLNGAANGVPLTSRAAVVIVALYMVPGARSASGLKAAILFAIS